MSNLHLIRWSSKARRLDSRRTRSVRLRSTTSLPRSSSCRVIAVLIFPVPPRSNTFIGLVDLPVARGSLLLRMASAPEFISILSDAEPTVLRSTHMLIQGIRCIPAYFGEICAPRTCHNAARCHSRYDFTTCTPIKHLRPRRRVFTESPYPIRRASSMSRTSLVLR